MNRFYIVEGECERVLVKALKNNPPLILPGSIQILNVVEQAIPRSLLIKMEPRAHVILLFDTDTGKETTLKRNIELIKNLVPKVKLSLIPQVENLEDELQRACGLKRIDELFHTKYKSKKDFKRDFCCVKDLRNILEHHNFSLNKLWVRLPLYKSILSKNDSIDIKIKQ